MSEAEPVALMTELDKQRISEAWWAGTLGVGDRVELESGRGATCCAAEVGGLAAPILTFRGDPDCKSVLVAFTLGCPIDVPDA